MWTMSSARDSNWRPQPPNLQELEKKEAAAMPVMVSALVHSPGGGEGARNRGGERGGRVVGFGEGAPQSAERRSRHRVTRQDSGGRSWEAGGTVGVGMGGGGGLVGGRLRHDLPTCWYLCPRGSV